jgi:hypothetical protein
MLLHSGRSTAKSSGKQCVVSPIITARSVRASGRRKAAQEDAMQTRKDKLRDEESLYSAAQELARWSPKS